MARDPRAMAAAILAKLEATTGRPVEHWLELIRSRPGIRHGEVRRWFKDEFGIGASTASVLFQQATATGCEPSGEELVAAQYAGSRAGLRPICDRLLAEAERLGEVTVEVRKTYVGLARRRAFAAIVPAAADRLDLGLRLTDVAPTARLQAKSVGGGGIDRTVALRTVADVDAEVLGWLRQAYQGAG